MGYELAESRDHHRVLDLYEGRYFRRRGPGGEAWIAELVAGTEELQLD